MGFVFVFRVEKSDRIGPYRCPQSDFAVTHRVFTSYSARHRPCPWSDTLGGVERFEYFGFKDIAQYTTWFNQKDRRSFRKNGYRLSVYRVLKKHVRYGEKQVVFAIDQSTWIGWIDPFYLERVHVEKENKSRMAKALSQETLGTRTPKAFVLESQKGASPTFRFLR